ncbi:hypothetical protein IMZ48_07270, partial [Candidatus Bathyarchaeota archaeon]|nr:hypothetical protein [Candidatus Bathyarchaeota archaeon]
LHLLFLSFFFNYFFLLYIHFYRFLNPFFILEHQDFSLQVRSDDGSLPLDSMWSQWAEVFGEVGEKLGQTFEVVDGEKQEEWMTAAGFGDVRTRNVKTAVGGWPKDERQKEIGYFNRLSLETGLEGFALYALTTVLGWEYAAVQVFLAGMRQAIQSKRYHAYSTW